MPSPTTAPPVPEPAETPADRAHGDADLKRLAAAIIVGAMAVILDTTIVSVGIHDLGSSLHASVDTIQWVSTAYLLAMFVTIPLTGWAQGQLGGKRLWLLALGVFVLGAILCALAWNASSLIAFRAVQGIGGGIIMPLMATVLVQAAHGRNLGRLMATVSLPAALGPILGPVLGGVILNYLSWHWMFLINLPLGAIGIALAIRLFPTDEPHHRVRLDVVGLLLMSPGAVAVIYGLSRVGHSGGFTHADVLGPVVAGLALLTAFAWWAGRRGARALIDVRLFRHRALAVSSALLALTGIALYGAMFLLPLYWQQVRGEDALGAGLLLIPQGVGAFVSRPLAGRLTDAVGGRGVASIGFAIVALATLPFALAGAGTNEWLLMAALLVRGLGLGAVMIPLMTGAYTGLKRDEAPDASIITRVSQQVGGSFGVALLAVILAHAAVGVSDVDDLAHAYATSFWWATAMTAAAAALSLLLPAKRRAPGGTAGTGGKSSEELSHSRDE